MVGCGQLGQWLGEHDLRGYKFARDRTRQAVDASLCDARHPPQDLLYPLRKHLRAAHDDHVAAAARKLEPIAAPLHEITRAHFCGVAGKLHEQLAIAAGREPDAAGERLAQPRRRKTRTTIRHAKHLAKLRRGVDLRELGLGKHGLRLLKERAVGRFTAERDPGRRRLGELGPLGRCDQPAQQRGRGGQDGHLLGDEGRRYDVGIARGRHHECAAGEQGLHPDLNARPAGGVVNEQPGEAVPLFGKPGRREHRIP